MNLRIPLSFPVFEGNEMSYSREVISSGILATSGHFISEFEKEFSKKLKTHKLVATNSGTSALHLALVLLGIKAGDEVICQSFTFCASANPIVYLGANPIFVDSELDTWNICPNILEETILSRIAKGKAPKAIILVHLFGMPAKMKEILEISSKYDIPIIEDAAEAVGSEFKGIPCGTFGKIGVYSFNGNKIISSGGGGALISNESEIIQKASLLSLQARENLPYYHHLQIGYNYRMNNLSAAIGLAQLERLDQFVSKRRKINKLYKENLATIPGIRFQEEDADSKSNFWLSTILIDEINTGITNEHLKTVFLKNGIESRFLWKPLHLQPVYKDAPFYGGKNSESLFKTGLCLPSSASLTPEMQMEISEIIEMEIHKANSR